MGMMRVLLVDDSLIDHMAVLRGFSRAGLDAEIQIVSDGVEALKALRNVDKVTRLENPFLLLLDLSMPQMGGISLLEELRKDRSLRRTVVFALTASDSDEDRLAAYDHFIAGCIPKAQAGPNLEELLKLLKAY